MDHKVKGLLKGLRYISQIFGKHNNFNTTLFIIFTFKVNRTRTVTVEYFLLSFSVGFFCGIESLSYTSIILLYREKNNKFFIFLTENEKEQEMVIGHPTDVKHVAHIGWDGGPGPTVNNPTWVI